MSSSTQNNDADSIPFTYTYVSTMSDPHQDLVDLGLAEDIDDDDDEYVTMTAEDFPEDQREKFYALIRLKQAMEARQVRDTVLPLARELKALWDKEAEESKKERAERSAREGKEIKHGGVRELPTWAKAGYALTPSELGALGLAGDENYIKYPAAVYRAIVNREV